ncbi:hypothetical protein [Campylobacter concisus]|uniref:hypothetical protein n=1 Tax=Campylobacter concisus TaxID=199 RepID=UPI0015E189C2|nr:hypothetical protein [Campylobacter concisus]
MNNILSLIGRRKNLFEDDINALDKDLKEIVSSSNFLVIDGAGSIGSAVTNSEIVKRYLANLGYEPFLCENEEEARKLAKVLPKDGFYPCLFAPSDTAEEKDYARFVHRLVFLKNYERLKRY